MVVPRVVGGRRVDVLTHQPAHSRTRLYIEPDRIEPYPGAERVAAHLDHFESGGRPEPRSEDRGSGRPEVREPEADERQPAGFQELATRRPRHFASWAARCGETYHTITW